MISDTVNDGLIRQSEQRLIHGAAAMNMLLNP